MCANYEAAKSMRRYSHLAPTFKYKADVYPGYMAPIMVPLAEGSEDLQPIRAMFGMVPFWAKDVKLARQTYNARSETVGTKPSFREAWKRRQFCLVPVQAIYEPNYENGKPERWRIARRDGEPFALAGIFESCPPKAGHVDVGDRLRSFSMLTINAAEHPVMRRFHAPDDEKRSVVVLDPEDYAGWVAAKDDGEALAFLRPFDPEQFEASAAPRPPKSKAPLLEDRGGG